MKDKTETDLQRETDIAVGVDQQQRTQSVLPALVEQVLGSLGGQAFHNFIGDSMTIWRGVSIATGPDVLTGVDAIDKEISVQHVYCHRVQIWQDTPGEYVEAIRCVLIEPDGTAYGYVSDGIATDLARIIAAFGMGPWSPPIKCKVRQFNTRKGRRAYSIQPV